MAESTEWTVATLKEHLEKLSVIDDRYRNERDRRYAEVAQARAEALKIKEEADKAALQLARDIQVYKDEKANELRSQIERERGTYVTQSDLKGATEKIEALIAPLLEFRSGEQGRRQGIGVSTGVLVSAITVGATIIGIIIVVANVLTTH
jgi:vacuolar-type H+-ATPase subunit H